MLVSFIPTHKQPLESSFLGGPSGRQTGFPSSQDPGGDISQGPTTLMSAERSGPGHGASAPDHKRKLRNLHKATTLANRPAISPRQLLGIEEGNPGKKTTRMVCYLFGSRGSDNVGINRTLPRGCVFRITSPSRKPRPWRPPSFSL